MLDIAASQCRLSDVGRRWRAGLADVRRRHGDWSRAIAPAMRRKCSRRGGRMGKRSDFARRPMDDYDTPVEAVKPLLPHLLMAGIQTFAEPCCGSGKLIDHLTQFGFSCVYSIDLDRDGIDALEVGMRSHDRRRHHHHQPAMDARSAASADQSLPAHQADAGCCSMPTGRTPARRRRSSAIAHRSSRSGGSSGSRTRRSPARTTAPGTCSTGIITSGRGFTEGRRRDDAPATSRQ